MLQLTHRDNARTLCLLIDTLAGMRGARPLAAQGASKFIPL